MKKLIRKTIAEQIDISKRFFSLKEIKSFYSLIDGKWFIQFHSPSFGLTRLFFHFELPDKVPIEKIINFDDPNNTVLTLSNVHSIREKKDQYIGTLLIPTKDIARLESYLQ